MQINEWIDGNKNLADLGTKNLDLTIHKKHNINKFWSKISPSLVVRRVPHSIWVDAPKNAWNLNTIKILEIP